ncbi:hypothetical protein KI809_10405 [Geobacter pelophilus]|jgi:hypothetical protein|uniref:Uncharacterized protein n=1 Tax=Geoanaerobacter pelophilus TaxID=60036 RepID=A0AAW4L4H4_9BACT|nr:hypothetical protein [Geoanaerobacter pelophilus]MBT0664710.1 hypothetical protein [Geoanaerobacter pelophilus]
MKTTRLALTTVLMWLAMFGDAFAVSTTRVYSSGIFVLGFIALCALVVVVQLIPAIMMLWGMIKGTAENSKNAVKVSAKK